MAKNQYKKEPLKNNVEEMFIGPFGSSLKNECFVDEEDAYCMVYEQKHAIQKTLDGKNRFVDKNKYYELKRFTIKPGDIIVSCRGTIGETFIVPENAPLGIMHPSIMKIRLKPNVYNIEYFNLLLKNRLKDYNKSANGSGIKMAISATELGKELFPIPPMDEQQRTSKIFLMVNHLILLRQQQLAKLDELVKARFVEMFGDSDSRPKQKIKDITKRVKVGFVGTCEKYYTSNSEIPMLRTTNITAHGIDLKDLKYVTREFHEKNPKSQVHAGDLLIARHGANGQANAYYGREAQCLNAIIIEPDINITNSIFLEYLINSIDVKSQINKKLVGSTQHVLNTTTLANVEVSIPEMREQQTFSAFVERVNQQKQSVQKSLEKLELMKKALMQEYFG